MTSAELFWIIFISLIVFESICTITYTITSIIIIIWEKTSGTHIEDLFPDWNEEEI